ncbi:Uncharacterized protein SCF082_LOCUS18554 [Durusdinium trenchii]|uniref:K Homology domain-containing protein n=1 Tax=Durusdinium trenchii TaxID=1381693 RepID=A0ABP0KSI6_9DINO
MVLSRISDRMAEELEARPQDFEVWANLRSFEGIEDMDGHGKGRGRSRSPHRGLRMSAPGMEALHMALDQLGKAVDLEYEVTCELPPEKVSAMIGPGGQIVRNVRQSTSTSIHFSEVSGAREQTMHIKGPLLGVYRAHVMMMRRYHEHEAELQFPPKGASRPGVKGESKGGYEKGYDRSYGKGHDGKGYGKGYEKGKGGGCDGKGFDRGYDQSREKGRFDVKGKDKGRDGCWIWPLPTWIWCPRIARIQGAAGGHAGKSRAAAERGEGQARPLRSEVRALLRRASGKERSGEAALLHVSNFGGWNQSAWGGTGVRLEEYPEWYLVSANGHVEVMEAYPWAFQVHVLGRVLETAKKDAHVVNFWPMPYFIVASFLDANSLAAADAACQAFRTGVCGEMSVSLCVLQIEMMEFQGLELEEEGTFQGDDGAPSGWSLPPLFRSNVGVQPGLPKETALLILPAWREWLGIGAVASPASEGRCPHAQRPSFRPPFAGPEISSVEQADEIAYCRCADVLSRRLDVGIYVEVGDFSRCRLGVGADTAVEVFTNPDNVSLAVVDFEAIVLLRIMIGVWSNPGAGRGAPAGPVAVEPVDSPWTVRGRSAEGHEPVGPWVTFSPDTGAVIRERKALCWRTGAYIQPLATITAGQGFEGCMGLTPCLAFRNEGLVRNEEEGDHFVTGA